MACMAQIKRTRRGIDAHDVAATLAAVGYNVHMRAAEAYCAEMRNDAGAGFKAAMSDEDYAENHNGARGQSGREIAGANVRAEWQTADVTRDAEAADAAVDDANSKRAAMVAGQRRYLLRHGEWVDSDEKFAVACKTCVHTRAGDYSAGTGQLSSAGVDFSIERASRAVKLW
eukprot:CAMPEP_0185841998 /NCGR_PEP_ID=MMETSP1353-20130828/18180_1 /TAXON_ID=1077150 /ORGANISM="Erythrolobus australicus, Strain CCMP3124" /LENGTH=171 /DNA_ID=CAMNT_0028541491 /DNA_START=111 /DNA_END=623 /DNA_ORIENTATION=-